MAGTPSNDLNISQPGVMVFDGVSTFLGRTISGTGGITVTNGTGISGNPTISITNGFPIAPGITGQVLQTNTAAPPTWSTATYPSTSGTIGNVIVSDGTNFVSQAFSPSFAPNQVVQDFDDFLVTSNIDKFQWSFLGSTDPNAVPANQDTNPGQILFIADGTNVGVLLNAGDNAKTGPFKLGSGSLNINWVMDLTALSTVIAPYTMYIGLVDYASAFASTDPVSGVYFQYTDIVNGGNWQIVCNDNTTATVSNTITPATTGFHNYGIQINSAGTSASFTIDGVTVANSPIVTNLPTLDIGPAILGLSLTSNTSAIKVDLFYYNQNLAIAR